MIKTPINDDVTTSVTAKLNANPIENVSATGGNNSSKVIPTPFSSDSWSTIKANVQNGNTFQYDVGDTKTVSINNTNYTVRIANKTTGEHCGDNDTAYSQTACGFVVEFVDIIELRAMKSTITNVGGYPSTLVYDYLNNTLPSQLSSELQSAIKSTRVISGYGSNGTDSANFVSENQKLYLLSGIEVFGDDENDEAAGTTHQLEYYVGKSACDRIKQYNGSNEWQWLRPAASNNRDQFRSVNHDGVIHNSNAHYARGVAPAFRIG